MKHPAPPCVSACDDSNSACGVKDALDNPCSAGCSVAIKTKMRQIASKCSTPAPTPLLAEIEKPFEDTHARLGQDDYAYMIQQGVEGPSARLKLCACLCVKRKVLNSAGAVEKQDVSVFSYSKFSGS